MKKKRSPKYMGTGIHVHDQFSSSQLVKGDTFFDADWGSMKWNGKKWVSDKPEQQEVCKFCHSAITEHGHCRCDEMSIIVSKPINKQ